jgi:hypothetical protein
MQIAAEYCDEHEGEIAAEMSYTELGDEYSIAFVIGARLDPVEALQQFLGEEEQVFDIDLNHLGEEDPEKVALNFFFMFVPKPSG